MKTQDQLSFSLNEDTSDIWTLSLEGSLDSQTTGSIWKHIFHKVKKLKIKKLTVDAQNLEYCDASGFAFLIRLEEQLKKDGGSFSVERLSEDHQNFYQTFKAKDPNQVPLEVVREEGFIELVGGMVYRFYRDITEQISFVGELLMAVFYCLSHPKKIRWKEMILFAEQVGVNAFPIAVLLGFLMGLIMAFQSAQPMKQFGADIFVANLVAISMVRELGPLMTAIILAGRSGSAFAAELGTMTVNEEINALKTMGLDPVRFLVVIRVFAAVFMMPFLTIFTTVAGLIGGAVVMLSLGYPLVTYANQITDAVDLSDFLGGLVKAIAFGVLVASVGCLRGIQTGTGAKAVGESTTSAVVSGLLLIVFADGLFSVVYYYLGI